MDKDIHQPLGTRQRPVGKRPGAGKSWVSGLAVISVIAAILGVASWMAITAFDIERSETVVASQSLHTRGSASGTDGDAAADAAGPANAGEPDSDAGSASDSPVQSRSGQSGGRFDATLDDQGNEITTVTPVRRQDQRPALLTPPDRIGQHPRLAHLPDPAIAENTAHGVLPIRGENGERAFDIYARPWSGARGARVAIIVGGLGLSQTGTQEAIATLPEEITLAFAANGNSLKRWMQEARRQGHEILLQVPFEPFDYPANDPGPRTLTVAAGPEANLEDLHAAMGRISNYTGITNFMGGRFLSDPEALEPVMRDLADRGLMFVDDGTSAQSLTDRFARTLGIPFAAADMVLDATQERGYILSRLDDLERSARRNGTAIGVASAFGVSVEAIAAWANEAKARGIEIVSASAVADDPER
ncbi:MAG: divergent polysaccharide deacetylase family protein [Hoeflea sp.]|uniref:divergent polysaccharide deacetylase family protein n=1 Tax=Hoeflea sp. TaxID=1940281 RepID=UPI0032EBA072